MKKYLKENKTLFTLMIIALVCIVISIILLFKYFYFGNGGSNYGDRLDGIENVKITEEKKSSVVSSIESNDIVTSASSSVTGRIIYIKINFGEKATLTEAQNIALKSLENFSEEEKAFYDFHYTLKQEATEKSEGFLIMGAKNVNGSNLVWENNNSVSSDKEE